jgi:hypothetical protein
MLTTPDVASNPSNSDRALLRNVGALLEFRAPYLEQKLLRLGVVERLEEAAQLFQEVKKYLVLADGERGRAVPMFSARVDEAWHQFALFTPEYIAFCQRFAGAYLHHAPSESAEADPGTATVESLSFAEFQRAYEHQFGPLASAWFDELHLRSHTRLRRSRALAVLEVQSEAGRAVLSSMQTPPVVLCRASLKAEAALRFVAEQRTFLVRELPALSDAERIALCQPLVKFRMLSVAP